MFLNNINSQVKFMTINIKMFIVIKSTLFSNDIDSQVNFMTINIEMFINIPQFENI